MNAVQKKPSVTDTNEQKQLLRGATPVPSDLENQVLRRAVQENLVSFPSHVPVFGKQSRPDVQQKIVVPSFVRGWTMDDIARRCGLGRHTFAIPNVSELKASVLAEQLEVIVAILNNQLLRLCSRPFNCNLASCGSLLAWARMLCSHLEGQISATRTNDEGRTKAAISAANKLFRRFQQHAVRHSSSSCRSARGQPHRKTCFMPLAPRRAATIRPLSESKSSSKLYGVLMRHLVIKNICNAHTNFRLDTVTYSPYTR
jgi:hypothetical protein